MKRRSILSHFGFLPLVLVPSIKTKSNTLILELVDRWKRSKEYTIAVLDAMPEEHIEFTPSEEQLTFIQHLIHLGFWNNLFMGFLLDGKGIESQATLEDISSMPYMIDHPDGIDIFKFDTLNHRSTLENKNIVKNYLAESFDFSIDQIVKISDDELTKGRDKPKPWPFEGHSNFHMILRGENHTAHHRAQAITYLRMKGVQPPSYAKYNTLPI